MIYIFFLKNKVTKRLSDEGFFFNILKYKCFTALNLNQYDNTGYILKR